MNNFSTIILENGVKVVTVPMNNTNQVRKSLSMNILPKGRIGDESSLTELIFDKVI